MKNYTILSSWRKQNLEAEVNKYLSMGYVLVGGVCVERAQQSGDIYYHQAVAKPVEKEFNLLNENH